MNSTDFYRSITPQQAKQMMCDLATYTVVIDVRRSDEYRIEHIKGALNLPLGQLQQKICSLVPDKQQEIILYCRTGSRSFEAACMLIGMGYKNVFDLGGIINWHFEKETGQM